MFHGERILQPTGDIFHHFMHGQRIGLFPYKSTHAARKIGKHGGVKAEDLLNAFAPVHFPDIQVAEIVGDLTVHAALHTEAACHGHGRDEKITVIRQRVVGQGTRIGSPEHPFSLRNGIRIAPPHQFVLAKILTVAVVMKMTLPLLESEAGKRLLYLAVYSHNSSPMIGFSQ